MPLFDIIDTKNDFCIDPLKGKDTSLLSSLFRVHLPETENILQYMLLRLISGSQAAR